MNHLRLIRKPNGMLIYRYRAIYHHRDIVCEFNLLCEVGERYRREYQKRLEFMAAHGWKFETRELSVSPWIADFAFKKKLSQVGEES